MSRVHVQARGGRHMHAAWEAQPLVRSAPRAARPPYGLIAVAFITGLVVGLMF